MSEKTTLNWGELDFLKGLNYKENDNISALYYSQATALLFEEPKPPIDDELITDLSEGL